MRISGTHPEFCTSRIRGASLKFIQLPIFIAIAILAVSRNGGSHDIITTPVTWDKEISRIFYSRCISCHREGGTAFSMAEYKDAFPWRTAIKEEVLERRMPPWGAVKGFGDFRNDQALTPEQLELLTSWAQGGSPEGDAVNLPPKDKLAEMMKDSAWRGGKAQATHRKGEITASGDFKLTKPFTLDGLLPAPGSEGNSFQMIAEFPDGRIEPLLWLDGYKAQFAHPFLFLSPMKLPAGTIISGIPTGVKVVLLPPQE
jgi:hypothetical protein